MGGQDKGWIIHQGKPLIESTLKKLRPQVSSILISANRNFERYAALGYQVLRDHRTTLTAIDYQGPLAGILQGLEACVTPWLQVVPCDTPHFPTTLVVTLQNALHAPHLAIVPEVNGRMQWVFCLLHKSCFAPLRAQFDQGERTLGKCLSNLPLQRIVITDPDSASFENLNVLQP